MLMYQEPYQTSSFGRPVCCDPSTGHICNDAADGHDVPGLQLSEVRQHSLCEPNGGHDVHVEDPLVRVQRNALEHAQDNYPGAVHQNVQLAKVFQDRLDPPGLVLDRGDVAREEEDVVVGGYHE